MSRDLLLALAVSVCFGTLSCASARSAPVSNEAEPPASVPEAPAAPAGKRAPCTLGADQTCNDDGRVSALWGRCTELGVCECAPGFELNPRGRCQPAAR